MCVSCRHKPEYDGTTHRKIIGRCDYVSIRSVAEDSEIPNAEKDAFESEQRRRSVERCMQSFTPVDTIVLMMQDRTAGKLGSEGFGIAGKGAATKASLGRRMGRQLAWL